MGETERKEWVDWQNTKILQKATVVDEVGNMLAIKRTKTGPGARPGKWDLPGGSVSPEDLVEGTKPSIEAIKREIAEETGLEPDEIIPVFVDSWVFTRSVGQVLGIAIGYRAQVKGIAPQVNLSDEHIESKWGPKEEILTLDFGEDGGLHSSIIRNS